MINFLFLLLCLFTFVESSHIILKYRNKCLKYAINRQCIDLIIDKNVLQLRTNIGWVRSFSNPFPFSKDISNYSYEEMDKLVDLKFPINMNSIYDIYEEKNTKKTCRDAFMDHMKLVWIHPFIDGNGKFARTILLSRCRFFKPINRKEYLYIVDKSIQTNDWELFAKMFIINTV
jgi:hypothetical protein